MNAIPTLPVVGEVMVLDSPANLLPILLHLALVQLSPVVLQRCAILEIAEM